MPSSGALDAITRHHHPDVSQPAIGVVTLAPATGFDWGTPVSGPAVRSVQPYWLAARYFYSRATAAD